MSSLPQGLWCRLLVFFIACSTMVGQTAQATETTTYVLTDAQGTVLAREDAHGTLIATYDYRPYGKQQTGPATAGPGYTGHVNDPDIGLAYMQARYYDSITGRFFSIDPDVPTAGNVYNFNRYAYVNDNPVNHTDPSGRCLEDLCIGEGAVLACAASPACSRAVMAAGAAIIAALTVRAVDKTAPAIVHHSDVPTPTTAPGDTTPAPVAPTAASDGNTNPYTGPADSSVVAVDKNGNAIPVDAGQSVNTSPNGDFQQVIGADGKPTGDRLDRGGHPRQPDPKAQQPHAHRPGVTDPTGNPHLPINPPVS